MKYHIVLLILIVPFSLAEEEEEVVLHEQIGLPDMVVSRREIVEEPRWGQIRQKLDHFDSNNQNEWMMRFLSSDAHYKEGSPMFVFIGGEGPINPNFLKGGHFYELAMQHNAFMFMTEHRYYGESFPTRDWSTQSLQFLTMRQALADLEHFIRETKAEKPALQDARVIVVGGSYAGALAIWARCLYPELIHAAYSSSGPILAKADFFEYEDVVAESIASVDRTCAQVIKEGVNQLAMLMKSEDGRMQVQQLLSTCWPPIDNEPYRSELFATIAMPFVGTVQYGSPAQVESMCRELLSFGGSPVEKVSADLRKYVSKFGAPCMTGYNARVRFLRSPQLRFTQNRRTWLYQKCTEFGFFHTTDSSKQLFGNTISLAFNYQLCIDVFGLQNVEEALAKRIASVNSEFGGLRPTNGTRIVSVHGSFDPWHALGMVNDTGPSTIGIFVHGTSHCNDLHAKSASDPEEMRMAKERVDGLIAQWLSE